MRELRRNVSRGTLTYHVSRITFHVFENQVVVITGAGRGIGAAAARLFAQHGARVVVHGSFHHRVGEGEVRHVAGEGEGGATGGFDLIDDSLGRRGVEVVDDDAGSVLGKQSGGGGSDPAPRSGDDDDLVFEHGFGDFDT